MSRGYQLSGTTMIAYRKSVDHGQQVFAGTHTFENLTKHLGQHSCRRQFRSSSKTSSRRARISYRRITKKPKQPTPRANPRDPSLRGAESRVDGKGPMCVHQHQSLCDEHFQESRSHFFDSRRMKLFSPPQPGSDLQEGLRPTHG